MIEGEVELVAVLDRFRAVAADWELTPDDVATLLQIDREELGPDLVPHDVAPTEHRIRLVIDIAGMVSSVSGGAAPRDWLHANDLPYDPDRVTPLTFLSGPLSNLRALRALMCRYA